MSDTVKKIFITLIVIVVIVIVGAILINVLVPNGVTGVVNAFETQIMKATGLQIDFNGDGVGANAATVLQQTTAATVEGFN